jgi:hypothetical protein
MIPFLDDLDGGKVSKLMNMLLQQGNTAAIAAAVTALGQIGYDTTKLRAVAFNGTTLGILMEQGDIDPDGTFSAPSNTKVPSTQAVVTYISNLIASGTRIRGSVTLTTASTYPVGLASAYVSGTQVGNGSGASNTVKSGDAWYAQNTAYYQMGPTATNLVIKNDLIIALVDGAGNTDAGWLVLASNIDLATTSVPGIMLLATLAKIQGNAGADANSAITIALLNSFLATPESGDAASKYAKRTIITQSLTNGSNTVTHTKNTQNISSVMFQNTTTLGEERMGWVASTVNTITVTRVGATAQSYNIFITY